MAEETLHVPIGGVGNYVSWGSGGGTVSTYDLALEPGYANYQQGYAPVRCRVTPDGFALVEGRVVHTPPLTITDAGQPIAQLPDDCAPGYTHTYLVPSDGQNRAIVEITAAGTITFAGFASSGATQTNWLALDGIVFLIGTG